MSSNLTSSAITYIDTTSFYISSNPGWIFTSSPNTSPTGTITTTTWDPSPEEIDISEWTILIEHNFVHFYTVASIPPEDDCDIKFFHKHKYGKHAVMKKGYECTDCGKKIPKKMLKGMKIIIGLKKVNF